jgi:hypothetical protein
MALGVGGARLFDPAGLEFEPTQAGLSRETVVRLVNSHEVPVAIHGCGGAVSWRIAAEASVAWRSVSPGFEDVADWRPRTGAPGELPYRAELWRALSGDGRVLVFRND